MSHATHSTHSHPSAVRMGLGIPNSKLCMWLFLGTEIMFFTAFIGSYIVLRMGSPGWPTDPHVTHINVRLGGLNTFVLIFSSYLVVVAHEAMSKRQFDRARRAILGTLLAGCVFLGIKAIEYYGKYSHDLLPGHVAETPDAAMRKAVRELREARRAWLDALEPGDEVEKVRLERARSAGSSADASSEHALFVKFDRAVEELAAQVKAERITLADVQRRVRELKEGEGIGEWLGGVHEPHPVLYGNLFTSCYFLMTGFHALHVVVGMLLWAIVLSAKSLEGWHEYVENSGLYWHFVDLVWIFLFPLIYIV
ncbi:MAG: heme-copper oxidase subunit III [Planctomycetota bacterium]|nr:MAG: heme-copper oxidase subunit III [Planctomycetota bacterium]